MPVSAFVPAPAAGDPITVYYRTKFVLTNISEVQLLAANHVDDGAVFCFNGVEVGRLRMPTDPVTFPTLAVVQPIKGRGGPDLPRLTVEAKP